MSEPLVHRQNVDVIITLTELLAHHTCCQNRQVTCKHLFSLHILKIIKSPDTHVRVGQNERGHAVYLTVTLANLTEFYNINII